MFHPAKAEFVRRYPGIDEALKNYELCSPENIKFAEPGRCPEQVQKTSSN
jgi:hypothetical protein